MVKISLQTFQSLIETALSASNPGDVIAAQLRGLGPGTYLVGDYGGRRDEPRYCPVLAATGEICAQGFAVAFDRAVFAELSMVTRVLDVMDD